MTDDQKQKTIALRHQGESYAQIAKATSLSVGTIRVFCSRNGLTNNLLGEEDHAYKQYGERYKEQHEERHCEQCGKAVGRNRKNQRFCSDACRMLWWKNHDQLIERKAYYTQKCVYCGKIFRSYGNKGRKYCSRECYMADRYKKENILDGKNERGKNEHSKKE